MHIPKEQEKVKLDLVAASPFSINAPHIVVDKQKAPLGFWAMLHAPCSTLQKDGPLTTRRERLRSGARGSYPSSESLHQDRSGSLHFVGHLGAETSITPVLSASEPNTLKKKLIKRIHMPVNKTSILP